MSMLVSTADPMAGSEDGMKKRLIATAILVLIVGGGVTIVMLTQPADDLQKGAEDTKRDPAAGFVPRRTRAEMEKGIAEARAEREKLAASSATGALDAEAQKARETQDKLLAAQTPTGAEAEARVRLAEIEQNLASTTDPAERERLERQKRLVEEVIAKLGKIDAAGSATVP